MQNVLISSRDSRIVLTKSINIFQLSSAVKQKLYFDLLTLSAGVNYGASILLVVMTLNMVKAVKYTFFYTKFTDFICFGCLLFFPDPRRWRDPGQCEWQWRRRDNRQIWTSPVAVPVTHHHPIQTADQLWINVRPTSTALSRHWFGAGASGFSRLMSGDRCRNRQSGLLYLVIFAGLDFREFVILEFLRSLEFANYRFRL